MKSRVLVLGSSGMAGHVITLALAESRSVEVFDAGPRRKVFHSSYLLDMGEPSEIEKIVREIQPDYIVNCVGILVEESEKNRLDAIWYNAYLPNMLSNLCERGSGRLIHLSTDCVFSGRNGPYKENSYRDGEGFYDRTKSLGEVSKGKDLTIRTSIVGPELHPAGRGLFNWFMVQKGSVNGFARVLWSGVASTQLADFIVNVITKRLNLSGVLHYATPGGISKFELLRMFNQIFERCIKVDPVDEPVADKRLLNTRHDLDINPPEYVEQLKHLKDWMVNHYQLYTRYGIR